MRLRQLMRRVVVSACALALGSGLAFARAKTVETGAATTPATQTTAAKPGAAQKTGHSGTAEGKNATTLVDINSASKAELMTLPGIGEALSQKSSTTVRIGGKTNSCRRKCSRRLATRRSKRRSSPRRRSSAARLPSRASGQDVGHATGVRVCVGRDLFGAPPAGQVVMSSEPIARVVLPMQHVTVGRALDEAPANLPHRLQVQYGDQGRAAHLLQAQRTERLFESLASNRSPFSPPPSSGAHPERRSFTARDRHPLRPLTRDPLRRVGDGCPKNLCGALEPHRCLPTRPKACEVAASARSARQGVVRDCGLALTRSLRRTRLSVRQSAGPDSTAPPRSASSLIIKIIRAGETHVDAGTAHAGMGAGSIH